MNARPEARQAPFWKRLLTRVLIWGVTATLCMGGYLLNCCLMQSPAAYQSLHDTCGWIPLDSLDDEARLFVTDYYDRTHFRLARHRRLRHFVWPDPYGICTGYLYKMTLDQDQILQLTLSKSTGASPIAKIDLQTAVETVYWPNPRRKSRYLESMLRRGHISPQRYRNLKGSVARSGIQRSHSPVGCSSDFGAD